MHEVSPLLRLCFLVTWDVNHSHFSQSMNKKCLPASWRGTVTTTGTSVRIRSSMLHGRIECPLESCMHACPSWRSGRCCELGCMLMICLQKILSCCEDSLLIPSRFYFWWRLPLSLSLSLSLSLILSRYLNCPGRVAIFMVVLTGPSWLCNMDLRQRHHKPNKKSRKITGRVDAHVWPRHGKHHKYSTPFPFVLRKEEKRW